ncbi:MAG: DUF1572 domain-containing protein [Acidobacteriota bacterium]|nr:DUF1572 domain-containing protein [Acidobacteriota bacterium]
MNQENFTRHYLEDSLKVFRNYKGLAEKAFAQVSDEEFFRALDAEANSIAVIIRHLAGNMRSRWTDFLTTDGEKPDRNRDSEFEMNAETTREEVMGWWEQGWQCTFDTLEPLQPEDFDRPLTIRGEPHTVVMAINRQLAHYASHIGQIILLAKHFRSAEWQSLSIPRRQSEQFTAKLRDGEKT